MHVADIRPPPPLRVLCNSKLWGGCGEGRHHRVGQEGPVTALVACNDTAFASVPSVVPGLDEALQIRPREGSPGAGSTSTPTAINHWLKASPLLQSNTVRWGEVTKDHPFLVAASPQGSRSPSTQYPSLGASYSQACLCHPPRESFIPSPCLLQTRASHNRCRSDTCCPRCFHLCLPFAQVWLPRARLCRTLERGA